jgi:exoribonuclease-2
MERYWTLRHVQQHSIEELDASLVKELGGGIWLVRADTLPLMFSVMGAHNLPRGARVRVKLADVDLMALDVHGTVLAHLDAEDLELGADEADQEAEDEDNLPAGPVTIAVDLNDSTPPHAP